MAGAGGARSSGMGGGAGEAVAGARRRVMCALVVCGVAFYTAWKSWAFVGGDVMDAVGADKAGLGSLSSALILAYAASKFVVAPLADVVDGRVMLAAGLVGVSAVALAFSASHSLSAMAGLWILNGLFSGASWPPIGKMLIAWFPPDERGTWWGVMSTTRPISGALLAFVVPAIASSYGWRAAVAAPALVSLALVPFLYYAIAPSPESLGFAPLPHTLAAARAAAKAQKAKADGGAVAVGPRQDATISALLTNPSMWWLNVACALCLAVKVAVGDWLVLWLVEERAYTRADASALIFWLEVGYGVGSLSCGWISDKVCGGSRSLVNLGAQVAASVALGALFFAPHPMPAVTVPVLVFVSGAAINMPATLIGMVASEKVPPALAATACGIVGGVGYLGASLCGYPLGRVVVAAGWPAAHQALVVASAGAALALLPLWLGERSGAGDDDHDE